METSSSAIIRNYIRYNIKIERTEQSINFINTCMREDLTPTFIRFKTGNRLTPVQLRRFRRTMLRNELHRQYSILDRNTTYKYNAYHNLSQVLHPCELNEVVERGIEETMYRTSRDKRVKSDKLIALRRKRDREFDNNWTTRGEETEPLDFPPFAFAENITNLTNISFDDKEMKLLRKGHKYAPPARRRNIHLTAIELETAINRHPAERVIRKELHHPLRQIYTKQQLVRPRQDGIVAAKTIKKIKEKMEEDRAMMIRADKNAGMVVIYESDYKRKMNNFIRENDYQEVVQIPRRKSTLDKLVSTTKQLIKQKKYFLDDLNVSKYNTIESKLRLPSLYGMIKLHKNEKPMRPIATFYNTPTNRLSKIMATILTSDLFPLKHTIKNTKELIDGLQHVTSDGTRLVSFDIVNLYANTPVEYTLNTISEKLTSSDYTDEKCQDILDILRHILDNNFCTFDDKIYKLNKGIPMGSPVSGALANIFLNQIEEDHILSDSNPFRRYIKKWSRYMDDVLCLWGGGTEDLDLFKDYLNGLLPELEFTVESEENQRLNFLDVTIVRTPDGFTFEIYRKPTTCGALIPADSNHHHSHKHAAFRSLIQRLLKIPLNQEAYNKELGIIRDLCNRNGYEQRIIGKILKREKLKLHPLYVETLNNSNLTWRSISYEDESVSIVTNTLDRHNIKMAFKTTNNLFTLLNKKKSENDKLTRGGVYKIKCDDCDCFYVGETGRSVGERIKEHRSTTLSAFGRHLKIHGHRSKKDENIDLLHDCKKGLKLTLLEALEIWKRKEDPLMLNEQVELRKEPLFKAFPPELCV